MKNKYTTKIRNNKTKNIVEKDVGKLLNAYYKNIEKREKSVIEKTKRANLTKKIMEERFPNRIENEQKLKEQNQRKIDKLTNWINDNFEIVKEKLLSDAYEFGVEESIAINSKDLIEFQNKSLELCEIFPLRYADETAHLFYKLHKEIPEFILYAPINTFLIHIHDHINDKNLIHYNLTDTSANIILKLEQRFKRECPDIFESNTFKKDYNKYFPSQINNLSNMIDSKFILEKFPNAIVNLDEDKKQILFKSNTFNIIANANPQILRYVSLEEFKNLLDEEKNYKSIGNAITKEHELLNKFSDLIASKEIIKQILGHCNYEDVKNLTPYATNRPNLARYIKIRSNYEKGIEKRGLVQKHRKTEAEKQELIRRELAGEFSID